jgi:hypothetical protein
MDPQDARHLEMMRQGRACEVWIINSAGKASPGEVRIQTWDRKQRIMRGLKFLGFCWAMSLITILIPVAHFILVPGFIIAGPIGAWILAGQARAILGGQGICPSCGEFLRIVRGPDRWPFSDLCPKCQSSVTVKKRESAPTSSSTV